MTRQGTTAKRARQPNKRAELVDAAGRLIAEKGVRGLRVEEVAELAGVAVSLIYYHFDDRSGLLQAAMEQADERAPSWELRTPDPKRTAYSQLFDVLLRELGPGAAIKRDVTVWHEVTASAVFDPDLRPRVAKTTRLWTDLVAEQIRAGQEDGSIRADVAPVDEAEAITCLLDGLCSRWLTGTFSRVRAREILADMIRDRLQPAGS
jgi:AcrR family transcriptional regulator